jgi:3',5'-cyclic AMP phosphodiesterase CpdA
MTTILQISDTHIIADGKLVSNVLDTACSLDALVQRIHEARVEIGEIDALLVTGDISEDGSAQSYERFKSLIAPLNLPLFIIPGNHDAREAMRTAFISDDLFPHAGYLNWHQKIGDINLIGLDTLIEGEGGGLLTLDTLDFLRMTLKEIGSEPVLVALHHPPFKSGIAFMDEIGLKNTDAFQDVLTYYTGDLRVLCGHIHSMMVVGLKQHVAISAPSPCSSFAYDTGQDAFSGFMDVGDGCLLHRWNAGFQTVRIGPKAGQGPYPF